MKNTRIDNIKFDYITFNDRYFQLGNGKFLGFKKTSYQVTLIINEKRQTKFQFVLTHDLSLLSEDVFVRAEQHNSLITDIVNSLDLDCLLTNDWTNFYESTKILAKD